MLHFSFLKTLYVPHSNMLSVRDKVVTSADLNLQAGTKSEFKPNFLEAEKMLKDIGCEVKRVRRIHNKMLAIDNTWLVEGSFNWLSSVRNKHSSFQYHEVSLMHEGQNVPLYIEKEKKLYGL